MNDFDLKTALALHSHNAGMLAILDAARLLRKHGMLDANDLLLNNVHDLIDAKPTPQNPANEHR